MKTMLRVLALLLIAVLLFNLAGCYGSFSLTRKLYQWNGSLGDKFINTAVMWVLMILPAYEATGFIDVVILNTIEFWTGQNPLAMDKGTQHIRYAGNDGKSYKIVTTQNQIQITEVEGPDKGKSVTLSYSPSEGNWILNDGVSKVTVASMNDNNLNLVYPNGTQKSITIR